MAEVTISNSPVHQDTILTGVFGQTGQYWKTCGYHTGTDFAMYGYSTPPSVYSVCSGSVVKNEWTNVLGWQVVIQDSGTGNYWRYCHLASQSGLTPGTSVTTATVVGTMGQTGTGAHGIHLHLEYSTSSSWVCSAFMNPSNALGIPNVSGTIVHYDGSVPPIPPTPPTPGQDTPVGDFYHRLFNGKWFWSTAPGYTGSLSDGSQKTENAKYICNYLKNDGWSDNAICVVIGAMDLVSTLNSAYKPYTDDESPFGLLGWRYWEFTDWVDAHGEYVADSDYTIIDNSIGRICWYRKYDLAWDDVGMTLDQFATSNQSISILVNSWITNYAYNTLSEGDLLNKAKYWYKILFGGNNWKYLYGKRYIVID